MDGPLNVRSGGRLAHEDVVFQFQVDGLAEKGGLRLVWIQVVPARPILFKPPVHLPAPFGFGRFGIRHPAGRDGLERLVFSLREFLRDPLRGFLQNPMRDFLGNFAKWTVSGVEQ